MIGIGCWRSEKPHPSQNQKGAAPNGQFCRRVGFCCVVAWVAGSAVRRLAGYRVAGIVVNDGDGAALGRTRVSLAEVQDRRKAESMITGADGRFEFRNVPAGKFSLEGARRNFLVTTYQWHEGFSTAIVTGAGLETENLVLRLIPLGSIAGKVIDEAGEPVRECACEVVHANRHVWTRIAL